MGEDAILIAVAVHDDKEARLEAVDHDRLRVPAGAPVHLRISYRLADTPKSREAALLRAVLKLDGEPMAEEEVAMLDRPMVDDEEAGDLRFTTPVLHPGLHEVTFQVRLEVSDETRPPHRRHTGAARTIQGRLELDAVE